MEHFSENNAAHAPHPSFWVLFYAVETVIQSFDICYKAIQGRDTLVSEQNERFVGFSAALQIMGSIEGQLSGFDLLTMASNEQIVC